MFPLHESTQRWICRAAFALLCMLPTTSLLTYVLWLKTPMHQAEQAADLSLHSGTRVSLEALQYPKPGVTRLSRVVLTHPQSGEELARIRELELHYDEETLTIFAAQPEFTADQFKELWRQITLQLLESSFPARKSMHLVATDATAISSDGQAQTFSTLEADYLAHGQQRSLRVTYHLAGEDAASPAVLNLVHGENGHSKVYWNTGEADLPIAPWIEHWPVLCALGDESSFRGIVSLEETDNGLSGHIAGDLSNVNLDDLVSHRLPYKLSGNANVKIHAARLEADRLRGFQAAVTAGPGVIDGALLRNAVEQWHLESSANTEVPPREPLISYQQLAAEVQLTEGKLQIQGTCPDAPPNTLIKLTHDGWRSSSEVSHNPATLIRILSSDAEADVPATEATRQLIRWLPLAKEQRHPSDAPRGHLRGVSPESGEESQP